MKWYSQTMYIIQLTETKNLEEPRHSMINRTVNRSFNDSSTSLMFNIELCVFMNIELCVLTNGICRVRVALCYAVAMFSLIIALLISG